MKEGKITEIKFWITASDCRDVSVTAIFCWCFKYTFTVLVLPIKTLSQGEWHRFTGKQHTRICMHAHILVGIYAVGV